MTPASVFHYGRRTPWQKLIPLRAGPLALKFDPNIGHLLQIRLGDHEVLRRIFAAVRDHAWDTVPTTLANLKTDIASDAFRLSFDADCRLGDLHYVWRGTIAGEAGGRITFEFDGVSRSHFARNRLGLCVLHPIVEAAGKPFTVEHWDGGREDGVLPKNIAPTQPCFDIRAFTWEVTPGARAELRFNGEVFEQEDQRNYTDASFKIYSTPQALPKPVAVKPGDVVRQSVTLTLQGLERPVLPINVGRPPQLAITTTPVFPLPALGLGMESSGRALTPREIERLKVLRLAHLRLDLNLSFGQWRERLQQATQESNQLGVPLHIALVLSNNAAMELRKFSEELRRVRPKIALWIVGHYDQSPASERWVRMAQQALQDYAPNVLFAAATRNFYYEINNNRPPPDAPYLPAFPVHPQVHLTDNGTLLENISGAAYAVESARALSSKPVMISSFTLKGPFNPGPYPAYMTPDDPPPEIDPRQMSLVGAGWTLASLAQLFATGNVHSVSCFETVGWRGVMETEAGAPLPEKFPSIPGGVFPLYHVLVDIGEFAGRQLYATPSSLPQQAAGLTLFDTAGRRRILVANLLDEAQDVKVKTGTAQGRVRLLDETNAAEAMTNPEAYRALPGAPIQAAGGKIELKLLPYALACVDLG